MKKTSLLFFIILFCEISFAQINVLYKTANDNQPWQIVKKSNGNYLIVINEANRTIRPLVGHTKILEMNPRGNFIDSIVLKSNTQDLFIDRLIPIADGYIGLGQINNRVDSRTSFWVFRLDKQLKRIQDTLLPISRSIVAPAFGFDKDSNIIISCGDASRAIYFGKINTKGRLYSWKADSSGFLLPSNSLIIRKDSLIYTIFIDNKNQFYHFDTAFNKIHESPAILRNSLGLQSVVTPLNDSIVCISGKGRNINIAWQHFFGVTTLKGREIFRNSYSTSNDTAIWGAWNYSSDSTKTGEWYWGGTHNFIWGDIGHSYSQSSFILHKLNKDYSTKWTKKYGGDAYYEMYGVFTTDDGGCMMYGTRYDYNSTPKYDAYILKVNGEGLITSESFIPLALNTISVYPNPSTGWINLDFKESLKNVQIRVFDAKGSLVHQMALPEANAATALDLSFLNNGIYSIQIMEQNRLFAVSRWVKGQ